MPDQIDSYFAADFAGARERFRDACTSAGGTYSSLDHPDTGPAGESLATDIARLGPADAQRLLVLLSGVHGPELLCGSGCQVGLLASRNLEGLPADTAVLLIHAINPWGTAHSRRVNEDNVDLCRNFMNFDEDLPGNAGYEEIHGAFAPGGETQNSADAMQALLGYQHEQGLPALMSALMSGQYTHADGFSYGGREATWSNRTLTQVLQEHGADARHVVGLDFHSGLGPYGYGSAVAMQLGPALARVRRHFGDWVEAPREAATVSPGELHSTEGHCADGFVAALPEAEVEMITIEFGTYSIQRNLQALLDDHWLEVGGVDASRAAIKEEMRITHFPDDAEWRYAVWTRTTQVLRQALNCLRE